MPLLQTCSNKCCGSEFKARCSFGIAVIIDKSAVSLPLVLAWWYPSLVIVSGVGAASPQIGNVLVGALVESTLGDQ